MSGRHPWPPSKVQHASDCAVHNEPALPRGECDCRVRVGLGSRPANLVTYFGGYASALHDEFVHVHVLRDGDQETFCGLTDGLRYGTPREVGRSYKICETCHDESQKARRDA